MRNVVPQFIERDVIIRFMDEPSVPENPVEQPAETPREQSSNPTPAPNTAQNYPTLRKEVHSNGFFANKLVQVFLAIILGFLLFLGVLWFLNRPKPEQKEQTQTATASSEKKTEVKTLKSGWVNSPDGLNLRAEPSTSSRIMQTLPNGTEFGIVSEEGDWFFVEATTRGYLSKKFVTVTKPTNAKKVYDASEFNFKFVYPETYKVTLTKADTNTLEFSYNDSSGGFTFTEEGTGISISGVITQNYPKAKSSACDITIGNAKECKMLKEVDEDAFYLVNTGSTIFRIGILTNFGNLPRDLTAVIFPSFFFEG